MASLLGISAVTAVLELSQRMPAVVIQPQASIPASIIHTAIVDVLPIRAISAGSFRNHSDRDPNNPQARLTYTKEKHHLDRFV